MNKLKTIATILLIILFMSPLIGTMLSVLGLDAEAKQYAGLQAIVMGFYNLPFLIVSLVTLLTSDRYYKKQKNTTARVLLVISVVSSVIGTVLMLLWGLGIFS